MVGTCTLGCPHHLYPMQRMVPNVALSPVDSMSKKRILGSLIVPQTKRSPGPLSMGGRGRSGRGCNPEATPCLNDSIFLTSDCFSVSAVGQYPPHDLARSGIYSGCRAGDTPYPVLAISMT